MSTKREDVPFMTLSNFLKLEKSHLKIESTPYVVGSLPTTPRLCLFGEVPSSLEKIIS